MLYEVITLVACLCRKSGQRGELRPQQCQLSLCLRHLEGVAQSGDKSFPGEIKGLLLQLDILPGELEPFLCCPKIEVLSGHLRGQAYQNIAIILPRGLQGGGSSFALAAVTAKKIEFPAGIEV